MAGTFHVFRSVAKVRIMPKFLIIRFSSIGDIVLTTPVIRAIKKKFPNSEIHFVTKKAFYDIVRYNPNINKVFLLDSSLSNLVLQLKQEHYTHIIDLHHNLRSFILKLQLLNVKSFTFSKLNFKKWLYVALKWDVMPNIHIVNRYLDSVKKLGAFDDGGGLDFFLPAGILSPAQLLPQNFQQGYFSIVVGAKHFTKRVPLHRIVELCGTIEIPVVLLGGPEDEHDGDSIAKLAGTHVFNACGKLSLAESAVVIKESLFVISSDTGLMHIAAAFHRNIISLWGNTTPKLGMYPYKSGDESRIFEVAGLSCRPCSKIGYDKCPKGHFKCMEQIDYSAIKNHIILLASKRNR